MTRPRTLRAALGLSLCACTSSVPPDPADGAAAAPAIVETLDERPEPESCLGLEAIDTREATAAARAKGLKLEVYVPSPVRCPALQVADAADNPLAARGPLAPVLIDVDAFLRPEVGVAEALALLGSPVLCDSSYARFLRMYVVSRDANVHDAAITLNDGALAELSVTFETPVTIEFDRWIERFGAPEKVHPGYVSMHPPDDAFSIETADYRARLRVGTTDYGAGPGPRHVRALTVWRSPKGVEPPRVYRAARELAQLAAQVLGKRPLDAHTLYGYLGVYRGRAGERIHLRPNSDGNLFEVSIVATRGAPHDARAVDLRLRERVPVDPASFAAAVADALGVPAPKVRVEAERARLAVHDADGALRGEVVLGLEEGRARTVSVARAGPSPGP